ncbi:hypothetical protein ABZX85_50105 [Streptomyces sp. NPDC004539]|uniref:hypothetical protein n=1 Tax=Streptomyces sp. NPDC004539 TaxID=3154280 RepID=UPI0033B45932
MNRARKGVAALLAATALALLPLPPSTAQAATADSSVTKSGTKGAHDDFTSLKVTVHQTRGLRGQALRVTWTGGTPAKVGEGRNFLSLMQCWGDDANGPDRTQCEYGSAAGAQPGDGRTVAPATDPRETDTGTPTDQWGGHYVPFKPVEGQGGATTGPKDTTYFTSGDTNAVPFLPNDGDGGGDVAFEVKSSLEQPALGCGARTTPQGAVQPCWLVAVPRGAHDADGGEGNSGSLQSSSLSETNWDQRIAFRLDFEPVGDSCDADKAERRIIGSELGTDAITSWQSALCSSGTHRFTFTQAGEEEARTAVTAPSDSSPGLALLLDPVADVPEVVHAPVAISGLSIGFVWMYERADQARVPLTGLKLNQRLLAKALTQSYAGSLVLNRDKVPAYLGSNPRFIGQDPEFQKLNPGLKELAKEVSDSPLGLAVSSANTDSARLLWKYVLADPAAREFLQGKADPWGMKVNPSYRDNVVTSALDYFPKADLTPTDVGCTDGRTLSRSGLDMVPYTNDMHDAALKIRRGDIGSAYLCVLDSSGLPKLTGDGRPAVTNQRQYGVVDIPSALRYQLDTAALPNADGTYVTPSTASLLAAVARMPDSAVPGVKTADPAGATGDAYPLTAVVYAAASTDQAADARRDYARVITYAAGDGQVQGTARGLLPEGYAPLPAALRTQAREAAVRLEKGVTPSASPSPSGDVPVTGGDAGGGGGSASGGGGTAGGSAGGAGTAGGGAGGPSAGPQPTAPSAVPTVAEDPGKQNVASSGRTPSEVLGIIRWVLLAVLIAGGVAALAGPVLLRLGVARTE